MALDQTANFVRDSLASSVASGDTEITVSDGSTFPDPANGEYQLVVWDSENHPRPDQDSNVEVMRATAISTDTITVSRGQEGTSAVSHPANSAVQMAPTAKLFSDIDTAIQDAGNSITTVGRNINNLTQEVARTQFEVGLTELGYATGIYDSFVDDSKIASQTNLDPTFGANGFLALQGFLVGDISTEQDKFTGHSSVVFDVVVADGFGYSASADDTVKKWDLDTLTEQAEFTGHTNNVNAVDVGGEYGYSAGFDDTVKKWDLDTLTEQDTFSGHGGSVEGIVVDSGFGYSASADDTVKKWDLDTLTEQAEFTGHTGSVYAVAVFDSFGYSASADDTVKKWDLDTLTEQDTFSGHGGSVEDLTVAGGYGYSTGGFGDETVKKWDLDTLTEQAEFTGHTNDVNAVAVFDSFGYSASADNTVKKWDVDTLTEQDEFTGHSAEVNGVVVADGFGYSASADDTVKKWGEGIGAETNGSATTAFKDIGIVPDRLVIGRDATIPTNATINYQVEDDAGNVETFTESELDTEVQLPSISTSNVRTTLVLERDTTSDPTPELNSYALYLSE